MSASASIDVHIVKRSNHTLSAVDIINNVLDSDWSLIHDGKISYLPIGDIDDYDWQEETISRSDFIEIVKKKEISKEIIGVNLFWKNSEIGVSMLMFSPSELSFNISINRLKIKLPRENDITDVSWYLRRILPCFNTDRLAVERFTFTQD